VSAREDYIRRMNTPTPFSEGPEMQNYNRMMELQNQASNFTKNDPRIQELKDARRQYNREDKYKIGERFGMSPLETQRGFANQSEALRTSAPNTFRAMYPIQSAVQDYIGGGGLLGLGLQAGRDFLSNVSNFGKDMMDKKGITGAADTDEKEMQDYAAQTFGFDGTTRPYPQQDFFVDAETFREKDIDIPRMDDDVGDFYEYDRDGNIVMSPDRPMPFDDSNREAGIMSQYPSTNFIGPRDDPNRRPTMADVAGPRLIDRGLFPFPGYNANQVDIIPLPYGGRGEMPQMFEEGSRDFYRDMREGFQRTQREKELLERIKQDEFYNRGR
jgi:hypothetical protein